MKLQTFYSNFFILLLTTALALSCTDNGRVENVAMIPISIESEYSKSGDANRKVSEQYTYEYEVGDMLSAVKVKLVDKATNEFKNSFSIHIIMEDSLDRIKHVITTFDENESGEQRTPIVTSFTYNDSTISFTGEYGANELTINNKGQVLTYKQCIPISDSLGDSEIYYLHTYSYDANGNIVRKKSVNMSNNELIDEYIYEYDTHNGIYKHVAHPQWFVVVNLEGGANHMNNMIKKSVVKDGTTEELCRYECKYNKEGYPISYKLIPSKDVLGFVEKPINITYELAKGAVDQH